MAKLIIAETARMAANSSLRINLTSFACWRGLEGRKPGLT